MMDMKTHWEGIYSTKDSAQVSWYQQHPALSLELIRNAGVAKNAQIIDVGGGASPLVDHLLTEGYQHLTVLDISAAALHVAQQRLGARAAAITWLEADITLAVLPAQHYDLWHDRAVFHFLTVADDRHRYLDIARHAIKPGGHMIMATFALEGPIRCSGLDIVRYSPEALHAEFEDDFALVGSSSETHCTPFDTEQQFMYCCFRKR